MKIVLERGMPVEGTVETEAGGAVAGALVTAFWHDDQPGWRSSETRADDCGRFSILVPAVAFLNAGVTQSAIEPDVVDDPQAWAGPVSPGTRVRLVMRDFASLELRLRGPSGQIRGAALTFLPSSGRPSVLRWQEYDEASSTLRLDHLLPGTYEVEVDPDDPDCLPTAAFVSVPGPPVEIQCPPAMRIEGLLEGDDIGGFEITWTGPGRHYDAHFLIRAVAGLLTQEANVGGDGSFAVVGLPPRAFRVELRSDEWLHDACDEVPAGANGVRLRVRVPATEPGGDGS